MMHSHRTLLVCSLVVMLAVTLGDRPAFAEAVGTASNPLVIATSRFHGFLPAYRVAEKLKDQGIHVKIIEFPSATERLEAVAAGYAHMSYAGLTASILLRARGKDVVVVASTNEKGRGLVAGPEIKNVKMLKGKKIGVTFGSIEHITLVAELRKNGLDPKKDVQLVNIPSPDQPVAFSNRSIDAYMGFEPWATYGVKNFGGKIISYPYDTAVGAVDSGVETSETFIAQYPKLVDAVIKAHIEAVKFYQKNPEEVIKAGVENYKVPADIMRISMHNIELTYRINRKAIEELARYLVELGFLKPEELAKIDWNRFINMSYTQG
ncbi:ABC transporter substrate-binding protein [Candidatus Deferrimicrobium sp.]|uniref:ABC transporter substrate-binding protein n=1 Tax=Candidatus Deferrimicrobium sp. TaxID=3060586 RepID=UPI003C5E30D3